MDPSSIHDTTEHPNLLDKMPKLEYEEDIKPDTALLNSSIDGDTQPYHNWMMPDIKPFIPVRNSICSQATIKPKRTKREFDFSDGKSNNELYQQKRFKLNNNNNNDLVGIPWAVHEVIAKLVANVENIQPEVSLFKPIWYRSIYSETKSGRPKKPKRDASWLEYDVANLKRFVKLVEKHPILWDEAHPLYKNTKMKAPILDEIENACSRFLARGRVHGSTARYLLEQLISVYRDEREAADPNDVMTSFPLFYDMSFYDEQNSPPDLKPEVPPSLCLLPTPPQTQPLVRLIRDSPSMATKPDPKPFCTDLSDLFALEEALLNALPPVQRLYVKSKIVAFVYELQKEASSNNSNTNSNKRPVLNPRKDN
ncbi:unnamed protein product [Caenorhabditis bovis]|uniref:MADF domain-containing protein n=1 Tax=Caenorhabditis bovis TaxID=2654633 RepID=A0A8S1EQL5_9PELO|nr:unnamed protein product [Caenorhabditis bovis]